MVSGAAGYVAPTTQTLTGLADKRNNGNAMCTTMFGGQYLILFNFNKISSIFQLVKWCRSTPTILCILSSKH